MKIFKMFLVGIILIFVLLLVELIITLPFGMPAETSEEFLKSLIFWELLLSSIPACLLTFFAALILKLETRKDTWLCAFVWTAIYVSFNLLFSIFINHNFPNIFGSWSLYVLIVLYFSGSIIYGRVKHLI